MKISVVATLFHSEKYVEEFYHRCLKSIISVTDDYEFIFVDDGSPDLANKSVLNIQKVDNRVILIELSRNFGHHQAMLTGLKHCTGEYIFLIDTDLEEEPELFTLFWEEMQKNPTCDVVFGRQAERKGNWFEKISGSIFYKFLSFFIAFEYPNNALTARLMRQNYVQSLHLFTERSLELWGVFHLAGFHQKEVVVHKGYKGSSTYTFTKKLNVAFETITSLSNRPLYFIFFLGMLITFFSIVNLVVILYKKYILQHQIEGWASLIASIWFIGGLIIFILGIISVYLAKIFVEVKQRPISVIKKIHR